MKATIINKIKLWWHCLTHLHREFSEGHQRGWFYKKRSISCWDCGYGNEK